MDSHEIKQNSILCCAYYWATKSSIPRASYAVCCMTKLSGDSLCPNRHDKAAGDDCAHEALADYAFRFKMDIRCICKYFWRLSLCHFFQTDVRRLKKSSVTGLTHSSTVASRVSFVYGLWALRRLERHSSQPFLLLCILSGEWCCYWDVSHCRVFRSRCHYVMWRKSQNKHISIHLASTIRI